MQQDSILEQDSIMVQQDSILQNHSILVSWSTQLPMAINWSTLEVLKSFSLLLYPGLNLMKLVPPGSL